MEKGQNTEQQERNGMTTEWGRNGTESNRNKTVRVEYEKVTEQRTETEYYMGKERNGGQQEQNSMEQSGKGTGRCGKGRSGIKVSVFSSGT